MELKNKNKNKVVFYILIFMLILLTISSYFQKKIMENFVGGGHGTTQHHRDPSYTVTTSSWSSMCTIC